MLRKRRIILASSSPRRIALIKEFGFQRVRAFPPDVSERFGKEKKARKVARIFNGTDAILIGADTIVFFRGKLSENQKAKGKLSSSSSQAFWEKPAKSTPEFAR